MFRYKAYSYILKLNYKVIFQDSCFIWRFENNLHDYVYCYVYG